MTTWDLRGEVFEGLRVDDYSSSSQIDVYCDGFVFRLVKTSSDEIANIYDPDFSFLARHMCSIYSSAYYHIGYDVNRTTEIIENTPSRVKIRVVGNWCDSGNSPKTANDVVTVIFTFYSDRFVVDIDWDCTAAISLLGGDISWGLGYNTIGSTNRSHIYESSGSELIGTDLNCNSADYIGVTSDELNVQIIQLGISGALSFYQRLHSGGHIVSGISGTTTVARQRCSLMHITDSADRVGGKKYDSPTARLALGDDIKDTAIPSLTIGSKVTDLNIPDIIDADCLAADGIWHGETAPDTGDSNKEKIKLTWDIDRYSPKILVHDWPIGSGTSFTNHLINHLKMDDNTSNNTILATVGSNGAWKDSSNNARNTNNDDVTDRVRGATALDTKATYFCEMSLTEHQNAFFKEGTMICKIKPQFAKTTGSHQYIFHIYVDSNNYMSIRYDYSFDRIAVITRYGGSTSTRYSYIFSSDNDLQQWHNIYFAWSFARNIIYLKVDDESSSEFENDTGTPSSGNPAYISYGAERTGAATITAGDFYLDEIKTYNECIVPYGAIPTYIEYDDVSDYSLADDRILLYYDFEASGANATQIPSDKTVTLNGSAVLVTTDPIYGTKHLDCVNANDDLSIPIVSSDILNGHVGLMSVWVNVQTLPSAATFFFGFGGGNNRLMVGLESSNYPRMYYRCNNVGVTLDGTSAINVNKWYHFLAIWSDSDYDGFISLKVNGKEVNTPQTVSNPYTDPEIDGTLYIGSSYDGASGIDCFMDQLFIANTIRNIQIPSAFGKPIWTPRFKKDNVEQQLGIDYRTSFTPDLSVLISDAGDVSS